LIKKQKKLKFFFGSFVEVYIFALPNEKGVVEEREKGLEKG
jgi:hypothetical protein